MFLPPVIFLGLGLLFWAGMQRENPQELPTMLAGAVAPATDLPPLDGLAGGPGFGPGVGPALMTAPGVKLVNFWASWCGPCRAEHPALTALAAEGITVIGINYKDQPADAAGFLAELGNPYAAVGVDATGRTGIAWGIYGVPETFVLDGAGRIVERFPGPVTERALAERIRPAIARAKGGQAGG